MSGTHKSDIAFIRALAKLLREEDLSEIEVEREYGDDNELKVRLSRDTGQNIVTMPTPAPVAAPAAAPAPAPPPIPAAVEEETTGAPEDLSQHPDAVTSPMVGTVYLQPEPGASAFVKVGDTVSEGQTIAIIEAMKTMNQIPAPRSGTVQRIVVDDGAPVEFGAPLMVIG